MPSGRLQHRDVGVGIDADLGGDLQSALNDLARRQVGVLDESARRRQRVRAAGADGKDAVVGLDDVARARDDETVLTISNGEKRLETAQNAIAAPILGELDGGSLKISR